MTRGIRLVIAVGLCLVEGLVLIAAQAAEPDDVRKHAERSFDRLQGQLDSKAMDTSAMVRRTAEAGDGGFSSDQYWIGKGQGDLTKGKAVCQRVSELSARTDLAKQIRVLVKEHMIDRVRERSGRENEQDIELTREEIVQEYLQDVKIVDRRIDEENKICTAIAVMPRSRVHLKPATDQELSPTPVH